MASKKLLVADDSLTIQKVIRLALSNEGYEIQAVSDGNDAVQQISLFRPDVVLIDVSLPGKNAFEVKRTINEHGDLDEVRFVLMSSAFEKVDEAQLKATQFHGRLTKPFDPAHLRQVLSEVLAQVTAKRMEKTQFLSRPAAPTAPAASPAAPAKPSAPVAKAPAPVAPIAPPRVPPPDAAKIALTPPEDADLSNAGHEDLGEDLMSPIQPAEAPLIHAPSAPSHTESLWDPRSPTASLDSEPGFDTTGETLTPPPVPGGGVPDPSFASEDLGPDSGPDADIRSLTESTIRMSGLDDFQWQVQEPTLKAPEVPPPSERPSVVGEKTFTNLQVREPTMKAFDGMADLGGSNFKLEEGTEELEGMPPFQPSRAEPAGMPPLPPAAKTEPESTPAAGIYHSAPSSSIEYEEPAFEPFQPEEHALERTAPALQRPDFSADGPTQPTPAPPRSTPPPPPSAMGSASHDPDVMPLSVGQMEELLKRQLSETLEKMAQQLLPEMAEKILKQEIHRMLSETRV